MRIYLLKINDDHVRVITKALQAYIDIGCGDFEEVMGAFNWHDYNKNVLEPWRVRRLGKARYALVRAQEIMGLDLSHTKETKDAYLIIPLISSGEIEINEEQAKIIINALDFYSRIGIGQFIEIVLAFSWWQCDEQWFNHRNEVERLIYDAQFNLTGMPFNASYGIFSPEVHENAKIAWDIQQVIRYRLAWDRNPKGGMTVDFDDPMRSSTKDFPIIEEKK
jgi:hypothetical protein